MRKVISILMIPYMILASGGFTIARHVCSSTGTFYKIGLQGTQADCGMASNSAACPAHPIVDNPDCCQNTVQTLSVDPFSVRSLLQSPKFDFVQPLLVIVPLNLLIQQPFIFPLHTNDRASPFLHLATRLAVICVFLK